MIKRINLSHLRNADFIQFLKDALSIVLANDPVALQIKTEYDGVEAVMLLLDQLFKTDRASELTALIESLDLKRDNAINAIRLFIQAYQLHYDEAKKAAADKLAHLFEVYGTGIAKENYAAETATINSFVGDVKNKPALADAVAVLGLGPWIDYLETTNNEFNKQYILRAQITGEGSLDTNILKERTKANAAYYELRDVIDSHFIISKKAASYTKLIKELNALIDKYHLLIAQRGANGGGPQKGEAPSDQPTA